MHNNREQWLYWEEKEEEEEEEEEVLQYKRLDDHRHIEEPMEVHSATNTTTTSTIIITQNSIESEGEDVVERQCRTPAVKDTVFYLLFYDKRSTHSSLYTAQQLTFSGACFQYFFSWDGGHRTQNRTDRQCVSVVTDGWTQKTAATTAELVVTWKESLYDKCGTSSSSSSRTHRCSIVSLLLTFSLSPKLLSSPPSSFLVFFHSKSGTNIWLGFYTERKLKTQERKREREHESASQIWACKYCTPCVWLATAFRKRTFSFSQSTTDYFEPRLRPPTTCTHWLSVYQPKWWPNDWLWWWQANWERENSIFETPNCVVR